jgi:inorganic pyrophosphatase
MDWKVLAMEVTEAKTLGVHDVKSYEDRYPGVLFRIREWFRTIKTFDGKAENTFLHNGNVIGRDETLAIIEDCSKQYKQLMDKETKNAA